jgi:hypothetical protein
MPLPRCHISTGDLELAEESCRQVGNIYRNEAARQENPLIRGRQLESAERFERIAEMSA